MIASGGRVDVGGNIYLGRLADGNGAITVSGATVCAGSLQIGYYGNGRRELVQTDGQIDIRQGGIGVGVVAGSSGSVVVAGGQMSTLARITVGENGSGTVELRGGVVTAQSLEIARNPSSFGRVLLTGGTLSVETVAFGLGDSELTFSSGRLDVEDYESDLVNIGGTLLARETTSIHGDYTQQSGATLEFDILGDTSVTSDFLQVLGDASLDGFLTVKMDSLTAPNASDSFTILSSTGTLTGSFRNVVNGARISLLDGNGSFVVHYGSSSLFGDQEIVLTGFEPVTVPTGDFDGNGDFECDDIDALRSEIIAGTNDLAFDMNGDGVLTTDDINTWLEVAGLSEIGAEFLMGDTNLNGTVDSTDLGVLLNNFSDTSELDWCDGNFDDDVVISSTDLGLLLNNFGGQSQSADSANVVPEPSSLLVCLGLLVGFTGLSRRRKHRLWIGNYGPDVG